MKKIIALSIAVTASCCVFAQNELSSLLLPPGAISTNGTNTNKPKTTTTQTNPFGNGASVNTAVTNNLTPLTNGGALTIKPAASPIVNNNAGNNLPSLTNTSIPAKVVATNNTTYVVQPLPPLTTSNTNVTKNGTNNTQQTSLPPLSVNKNIQSNVNTSLPANSRTETIDPQLLNKKVTNTYSGSNNTASNNLKMPALEPIENTVPSNSKSTGNQYAMPALAEIGTNTTGNKTNTSTTAMPELAPIEGNTTKANNTGTMPELAPIDNSQNNNGNYQSTNTNKISNGGLRALELPKGVVLDSKKATYIFKPTNLSTQPQATQNKEVYEYVDYSKPSAGGGMGLIADIPANIEDEVLQQQYVPSPQPYKVQAQQVQQPQQQVVYQQQAPAAVPCQHIHASYCPCCVKAPAKKWYPKKKWVAKKVYKKPAVTYVYQQPAPQPKPQVEYRERIVYVPVQQAAPQPVQQPVQQDKVVYRDYTKVYYKEPEKPSCQCPINNGQNNNQGTGTYDPQKYYYPAKYQNLTAGPTSGDYPVAGSTSNAPMQYSFYLNKRGKYSVGIYNQYFTVLLSQNGKVIDYKVNGDPNLDPGSYKPKLNYFGSPESIAGIPIEYNYNRSVHKIGNIKMEYDFEGFFKSVNGSSVFYNNRSSLQRVDDISVHYDAGGNVSNVDYNNGLIQYNPNN